MTAPQKNKKRGLPVGLQANGRPLHGVCFKNAAAENSVRRASARRPGFLPEIVKIIAECRRICQDSPPVPLFAVIYDTIKKLVRRGLYHKAQGQMWEQYKADYPDEEPKKK